MTTGSILAFGNYSLQLPILLDAHNRYVSEVNLHNDLHILTLKTLANKNYQVYVYLIISYGGIHVYNHAKINCIIIYCDVILLITSIDVVL